MTKEELIAQIMAEAAADGEPVSEAEAAEMAEMEIKAKGIKHYEKSDKPTKRKAPVRKKDGDKEWLITTLRNALNVYTVRGISDITVTNAEKYIDFTYNGKAYTVNLVQHRPPK